MRLQCRKTTSISSHPQQPFIRVSKEVDQTTERMSNYPKPQILPLILHLLLVVASSHQALGARLDDLGETPALISADSSSSSSSGSTGQPLVWQPLRATFRPLNRQSAPPPPPPPPQPAALTGSGADGSLEEPASFSAADFSRAFSAFSSLSQPLNSLTGTGLSASTTTSTTTTTTSTTTTSTTPAPIDDDDGDQPTRVPLNRFRPTRPPSVDPKSQPTGALFAASGSHSSGGLTSSTTNNNTNYRITSECFECICEASTSCNPNSRCQTSDVRHTRCGLYLISYDQWLESGLSRQLVTREALARDAAADERAFYECVTERSCAERLLAIYMQKSIKDCDKDGRVDCYDVAAIHQGGTDQCNGEGLLDSQYWSDFNACFGFGR